MSIPIYEKTFLFAMLCFFTTYSQAQVVNSHIIPIEYDTVIQWAAESNKVVNLTPKTGGHSLKKWYLDKLKNSSVTAYREKGSIVSSYSLSIPGLQTQDWLKDLAIELSPHRFPQEWYFLTNHCRPMIITAIRPV